MTGANAQADFKVCLCGMLMLQNPNFPFLRDSSNKFWGLLEESKIILSILLHNLEQTCKQAVTPAYTEKYVYLSGPRGISKINVGEENRWIATLSRQMHRWIFKYIYAKHVYK